ncbi:MAG: S-methyl-5'-thioadenosine phosphorylase [Chloroflexi bacterium]|nr:S-methyl-5'-thioadenosine phosphorylase [Chloroflexota bacterium]
MATAEAQVAIIGGSGLYDMDDLKDMREVNLSTPFGAPSDSIVIGALSGIKLAFLPRHGRGHRLSPTELPARANIYALKSLGVERIISVSAVGSLKEDLKPLDLVVPDQLIDRTKSRVNTFFGDGVVVHVGFADPFCPDLSDALIEAAKGVGASVHKGGTYVVMEGPLFSTKAESRMYRSWGASIIGMTALPEAKLAREAEICYATLASVTDYDVWHESEEPVSVEMVLTNLAKNVATAKRVIRMLLPTISEDRGCSCASALKDAIITRRDLIPEEAKQRLSAIMGRYIH